MEQKCILSNESSIEYCVNNSFNLPAENIRNAERSGMCKDQVRRVCVYINASTKAPFDMCAYVCAHIKL